MSFHISSALVEQWPKALFSKIFGKRTFFLYLSLNFFWGVGGFTCTLCMCSTPLCMRVITMWSQARWREKSRDVKFEDCDWSTQNVVPGSVASPCNSEADMWQKKIIKIARWHSKIVKVHLLVEAPQWANGGAPQRGGIKPAGIKCNQHWKGLNVVTLEVLIKQYCGWWLWQYILPVKLQ